MLLSEDFGGAVEMPHCLGVLAQAPGDDFTQ